MKTIVSGLFAMAAILASSQLCQAEPASEKEIVRVFMEYIDGEDGYSIDWPASIAETGKLLRNYDSEGGRAFLAFVVRGHLGKSGPQPPSASHHEAINKRIGEADYEFIWPAPMVSLDHRTETLVFVRPRKPAP